MLETKCCFGVLAITSVLEALIALSRALNVDDDWWIIWTIINHRKIGKSLIDSTLLLCERRQNAEVPSKRSKVPSRVKTMKMKIFRCSVGRWSDERGWRNPGTRKRPGPCSCSEDVNLCRIHQETNSVSPKDTVHKIL